MASAYGLGKLTKTIKEIPAISVKDLWRQPGAPPPLEQPAAYESPYEEDLPLSPRSVQVRDAAKQATLETLDPQYYEKGFKAMSYELSVMGLGVTSAQLEEVAEARTAVLDVLGEMLSQHILQNYASFVKGIDSVSSIEEELRTALETVAAGRSTLAQLKHLSNTDVCIAQGALRKRKIASVLDALQKLKAVRELPAALRASQEGGDFSNAFWLCAQCCQWMSELSKVHVVSPLTGHVNGLYEETTRWLEGALQSLCSDFRPEKVAKVLEGYIFLGNVSQLGGEVTVAFTNALDAAVLAAARNTVVAHFGGPERAKSIATLQEAIKGMPIQVLHLCLSKVLTATFEVLASHQQMRNWMASSLRTHSSDLTSLQGLRTSCQMRLSSLDSGAFASALESAPTPNAGPQHAQAGSNHSQEAANQPSTSPASQPASRLGQNDRGPSSPSRASLVNKLRIPAGQLQASDSPKGVIKAHGSLSSSLQRGHSGGLSAVQQAHAAALVELQDAEWNEQGEAAWGSVLQVVMASLNNSRNFLWEEAVGKLSILLSSPLAFGGDHLMMAVQWAQAAANLGQGFCDSPQAVAGFRSMITAQSRSAFDQLHAAKLDALYSMLDRELWKSVPAPQTPADGDLAGMLRGPVDLLGLTESASEGSGKCAEGMQPWRDFTMEASTSGRKSEPGNLARDLSKIPSRRDWPQTKAMEASTPTPRSKGPAMALSAVRLLRWMREYGELFRVLRPAPMILAGVFEMFEMLLACAYVAFSDVPLTSLLDETVPKGSLDISRRLHKTLARIANQSLVKYRAQLLNAQSSRAASASSFAGGSDLMQQLKMRSGIPSPAPEARPPTPAPALPVLFGGLKPPSAGNLWGLHERSTAVESVAAVADELRAARADVLSYVPASEQPVVEHFFSRTVEASGDVGECIFKAGVRLALPLAPVVQRIASVNYDLDEPAEQASEWVEDLCGHITTFRDRLAQANSLPEATVSQVWRHAIAACGEAMLDGFAKVRGRCSAIGRNTMSADLQEAVHTIRSLAPASPDISAALEASLRLCDIYIKAFFMLLETEVHKWAQLHPEYSKQQHLALAGSIADSKGMRKKDKAVLLASLEAALFDGQT